MWCSGVWFAEPGGCAVVVPVEIDLKGFLRAEHCGGGGSLSTGMVWESWSLGASVGLFKGVREGELGPHTGRPGAGCITFPLSPGLGLALNLEQSPM